MCEEMRWCKYHEKFEPAENFRRRKDGVTMNVCRVAEYQKDAIYRAKKYGRPMPTFDKKRPYARNDPPDPLNEVMRTFRGPVEPLPWRVTL